MSVFKEKDGRCEGANPLGGKARLQTRPGRFTWAGAFFKFAFRPCSAPQFCKRGKCALALTIHAGASQKGGNSKKKD